MASTRADVTTSIYPELRLHAAAELRNAGLSSIDAEDLVQEAFLRWQMALDTIQRPEAQARWMKRTIRHLVADQRRRSSGARPHDPLEEHHLSLSESWARGGT